MRDARITRVPGAWTKFRLLMWKNFLQQWRHPIQTTCELLLPTLTMSMVLVLRGQIEPFHVEQITFPPVPAHTLDYSATVLSGMNLTEISIAYSPENEILDDIIRSAVANLLVKNGNIIIDNGIDSPEISWPEIAIPPDFDLESLNTTDIVQLIKPLIRVQAYTDSAAIRGLYTLEETTRSVIAAVEFDDSLYGAAVLPNNIVYALRFPERPRLNSFFGSGSSSWRSDVLFPAFELPGPRSRESPDGGTDPGYVSEMFIALQHMISTQLVSRLTGQALESFDVNLQRYPHPAYINDYVVEALEYILPAFIMISFSYSAVNIVRAIVVEKELQLKETLIIIGVPSWLNWVAWFCKQFLYLLVAACLLTILLKVNWFTNEEGFSDYAVFTNTPWTVLFFFLILYMACIVFFCFMVSGFFSSGSTAALFAGVIWFLTFVPAFMLSIDVSMSLAVQVLTCISINSAMSYGFKLMIAKESTGGMQWGEFFSAPTLDTNRLLFGHVMIMLFVNCVLYMLVALYLEQVLPGPFGAPKPWYFLFQKQFWGFGDKTSSVGTVPDLPESGEVVKEKDPTNHAVGVKISNLSKVFGNFVAVNQLSLNIYDDQITVLLGHNGAGKSTTISMLTGNLKITSGSVSVAGYDMSWQTSEARAHIGLCPQHNVIFNELTVREHLEFFAKLKGFDGEEMKAEVDSLIEKLELQEKGDSQAHGLSGGQKRRLCVGVALCGDARVVLLDEPTSGMDPSSRRALWDLLQKEKKGRSMILTTHFMDEADILGDRIAIMASGMLKCVGSPYFLKKHYGAGYTLVIVKDAGFQLEQCTQVLRKFIPNITVKEDRGSEVTYNLTNEDSHKFETMLYDLENNNQNIGFKNYGLAATTLEDVFMAIGSDVVHSESDDCHMPKESMTDFDASSTDYLDVEELYTGIRLLGMHIVAVWLKLGLVSLRSWLIILMQLLVPILVLTGTLAFMEFALSLTPDIDRRPITLAEGYTSTESLLTFNGEDASSVGSVAAAAYEMMIRASGVETMTVSVVEEPLDTYYLSRGSTLVDMGQIRNRILTGATFSDEGATAWFSNFAYHDVAASLAAVHNALLKATNPNAEINVFNHPLEANYSDQSDTTLLIYLISSQLSSGIGISLGIASAVYVMFYVKERVIRAKLLQKASGIQPVVLWLSAAVFDWVWFLIISVTILIICLAFGVIGLSTGAELGRLYLMLMIYGASMLPVNYLVSHFFDGPALGFVVMFFINILFGNMGAQVVELLIALPNTTNIGNFLDTVLQFFPLYSVVVAIRYLNNIGMTEYSCMEYCEFLSGGMQLEECNMTVMCEHLETCCVRENAYFDWEEPGVLRYITTMLISCVAFWGILMAIEYNVWQKLFSSDKKPPPIDHSTVDTDVLDEARHVEVAGTTGLASRNLVARNLTKYYGKHLAVNQISFGVENSECFGLLGVNGAGKTTTFKMLMGDESISSGDAYVSGYSVKKNITQVHENIGYCPQFDAVFGELTGRETLLLFSLLRGFSTTQTIEKTATLAHALGFTKHLDKKVYQYSGGNKRKLSTAIALLGRTRLVFVDEPTTGVDPAAKRQVWQGIRDATRSGRGVVLTSHSMEECEALCSRLTIMVNGRFQCLGSPQHLKNKFSEGFTLTIKMRVEENQSQNTSSLSEAVDVVKMYVSHNFTDPKLMEEYQGLLTYYLPDRTIAWSRMFGIMERAKRELPVEDYSISQTTLEQIFLQFTKYQQESNRQ